MDPIVPPASEPGGPGEAGDPERDLPADVDAVERPKRRLLWYISGTVVGLLVAVVVAAAFIKVPYYRVAPGSLYPTEQLISVDGAQVYRDPGEIDFTTISMKRATVLDAVFGWNDPAVELVDQEIVEGGKSPEQNRTENLEMMADSKQIAAVVALRKLGYDVKVVGTGALVRDIGPPVDGVKVPADGVLHRNDTIVEIDGVKIELASDAVAAITAHPPGDTLTLKVEPPPGQGEPRTVQVTLVPGRDDPSRGMIGIDLGTRHQQFQLPFTVSIDSKEVSGPSAGLAFTLGLIDTLTPGSLTGGKKVATTGTINLDGSVGAVGGVEQKTYACLRDGVELFLVPPQEYEQAVAVAGGMKVVAVQDLDEALRVLADNGGDVDASLQASGPAPAR